jgi:hypothetical protein
MSNILKQANEIVYERTEERTRQYGDFHSGMERASAIYSAMTGKDADAVDMYKALIALKLSRESYNHKEDNLLDAVAYMASMNDYINKNKKTI